MSVYATRKLRNLAASLILLSGFSHVAQLWLETLTGPVLISAAIGMIYLLLALGLFGQSRFSLGAGCLLPALSTWLMLSANTSQDNNPFLVFHLLTAISVALLSLYILVKTRHEEMD